VLAYPFAPPGHPRELRGRDAIGSYFAGMGQSRQLFVMDGVEAVIRETDDPEVVVTEITHHGRSLVTGAPYRFTALGLSGCARARSFGMTITWIRSAWLGSSAAPANSPPPWPAAEC
jgi:hypothetical protein